MPKPVRVLLIEDSKTYSQFIQGILQENTRERYQARAVDSLQLVSEAVEDFGPDLILLDLFLPDSQGLDTLRWVKNFFPDRPIVVLSSLDDEDKAFRPFRREPRITWSSRRPTPRPWPFHTYALERHQIEQALMHSQQMVRCLLDSIQAGIVIVDPDDHKIVNANSVALQMFHASPEEALGSPCHRFMCPDKEGQCPITDLGAKSDNSEQVLAQAGGNQLPILKTVAQVELDGRSVWWRAFWTSPP